MKNSKINFVRKLPLISGLAVIAVLWTPSLHAEDFIEELVYQRILMPSDAVVLTWRDSRKDTPVTAAKQKEIALEYLAITTMKPETELQRLALAEMHFLGFKPEQAKNLYESLQSSDEETIVRHARRRMLRMTFAAFNDFALTEQNIRDYRNAHDATLQDYYGVYTATRDLANYYYKGQNAPDKALELVLAELADPERAIKQASPRLLIDFFDLLVAEQDVEDLKRLGTSLSLEIRKNRDQWLADLASDDLGKSTTCSAEEWNWYLTMNGVRPGEKFVETRSRNIERTLEILDEFLEKLPS
jgi:hypothetical protein